MEEQLVNVGQFQFLPEAQAAQMHLEGAGIKAFLDNAGTVNMDWFLGNATGYIKLQVPESQANAALAILEEIHPARRRDEDGPIVGADAAPCLECGAALVPGQARCSACGWSYAEDGGEPSQEDLLLKEPRGEAEPGATQSSMDKLRSAKKPILLLMLIPLFSGMVLLVLAILIWVVRVLFPEVR